MTRLYGRDDFSSAREAQRGRLAAERAALRVAALARLERARDGFLHGAEDQVAATEADRLETIGDRIATFVEGLEALVERLETARDVDGPVRRRSVWRRAEIPAAFAEGLDGVLTPAALGLVLAAARLEACG